MLAHCNLKQNVCLCSKQSSLFSCYALPSGGKSKSAVVHCRFAVFVCQIHSDKSRLVVIGQMSFDFFCQKLGLFFESEARRSVIEIRNFCPKKFPFFCQEIEPLAKIRFRVRFR